MLIAGGEVMLGYIKPAYGELRVREHEFYRAAYCGLCRSMGKCTGCASRMTLSYDFVFLALVRMALSGDTSKILSGRCMAHPMKKKPYLVKNPSLDFSACAAAVLMDGKVSDDIADEKGLRRTAAKMLRPFTKHSLKRSGLAELADTVNGELEALSALERERSSDIDAAADCFGRLLGSTMSFGLEGMNERIAYEIGRYTGRFIYVIDAADDMAKDVKKCRYNPLIEAYGKDVLEVRTVGDHRGRSLVRQVPRADVAENIITAARLDLIGLERAENLIDYDDTQIMGMIRGIIGNIIGIGMPGEMMKVLGQVPAADKNRTAEE